MSMRFGWLATVVAVAAVTQACVPTHQRIKIDPKVTAAASDIGNGKTVGLQVVGLDPAAKAGQVGDPQRHLVDVQLAEDPGPAVQARVADALQKMGFTVKPLAEGDERTLRVEISQLKFQSLKTPLKFETQLKASVTGHGQNGLAHFDRTYNVSQTTDSAGAPNQRWTSQRINSALSMAVQDLLDDKSLIDLLAK